MDRTRVSDVLTNIEIFLGTLIGLVLVVCVCANIYVRVVSYPHIVSSEESSHATYAIVLGAAVYQNGLMTDVLRARAQTALDLYVSGQVERIFVSGDSIQKGRAEVQPVVTFLEQHGVRKEDIVKDPAGIDTYHSMYRAVQVFGVRDALIVTQGFHIPRAVYIARSVGIDAQGVATPKARYDIRNTIREFFATIKAIYEVTGQVVPEYAILRVQ